MSKEISIIAKELYKSNKTIIVFTGTGITGETGIPKSWELLMDALIKDSEIKIDKRIDNMHEEEYPGYAQYIYDELKKNNKEEKYYSIIKEQLNAKNARYSSAQIDIIDTYYHVVTTNFDNTFEDAVKRIMEVY